jgi:hypothetical protein
LLKELGHPLSALPVQLLDIEAGVEEYLPRYSLSSTSWTRPYQEEGKAKVAEASTLPALEDKPLTDVEKERLLKAVSQWNSTLAGKTELHCFHSKTPLTKQSITSTLLASLPIESFDSGEIHIQELTARKTFALLFGAASQTGSALPLLGPYGRLAAWQSLAGLTAAMESESTEGVSQLLDQCHCFQLYGSISFFDDTERSLSLLCLRPDALSLVLFVASDGPGSFF